MSKYVFDIEANGFLKTVSRMWVLVAKDIDTGEIFTFKENDLKWKELFEKAESLIGHNITGYDLPVLQKIFNFKPSRKCKIYDTFLMSLVINYNRFKGGRHSLENWGNLLGFPKIEFDDFSQYSEEMLEYCVQDVELGTKVYFVLKEELGQVLESKRTPEEAERLKTYLRIEHFVSEWSATAELHGWPFDVEKAKQLMSIFEKELEEAHEKLSSKLGFKTVAVDKKNGIVEVKTPKWTKAGCYAKHTAEWFDIDPWSGYEGEERLVEGPYCRIKIEPLSLDSVSDMKIFLFRNGWVPTEWNVKRDPETNELIKTSPKITEDSLEFLGGDGKLFVDFLSTKSRHSILKTWLNEVDEDGNLHGGCFTIGTPSMRARHNIIVNVPSSDSPWGKEMRELFICKPGWKLIGCDSSGNQARGLAHYLKSEEYTNKLLKEDIHKYNAAISTQVLKDMGIIHEVPRGDAKRLLYAFLFGASGAKLWLYIMKTMDQAKGNKFKKGFTVAVPGFKELLTKLENIFGYTKKHGDGYIIGIGGNKIFVDSYHKLLVYLLQACEKATCGAAIMLTMLQLEAENIPYIPLIFMHDEEDFMVPEEYAERAAEIGKEAFREGPKLFNVQIMDGEAKIGNNWYEVH